MFTFQPSIRQKITLGYYAITAMIVALSVFTLLELRYIENKIMFAETISEFFDSTLEIRRFEKNYFLYEKRPDYDENIKYVAQTLSLIEGNRSELSAVTSSGQIEMFRTVLNSYRDLMEQYGKAGARENARRGLLAGKIRSAGKDLIALADDIARTERRRLQHILSLAQRILIISILLLSVAVVAIGQVLSRMVVKPLKALEKTMGIIAEGKFERVAIDSKDREIASLTRAFNKMLKELELHERHLIQSEKLASLGTLLSGIAHELNNPLSNISSSNQIMLEELKEAQAGSTPGRRAMDPAFVQELAAQIGEQTDRARNIVRSLLDFSRDREFKKESLSLKAVLEETLRFIRGQFPQNIKLTLSVPDDVVIFADKQRIQQAFLNLIKNAVESITAEEGSVGIRAAKRRAIDELEEENSGVYNYLKYRGKCTLDQDTVDIEVRDNGAGIPPDVVTKIFDPFFTTKDVGKGSGLGLFIVHEIIEEHDGCIAVDSEPGRGTAFLIRLPLNEARKEA
jgi:two-component system, NtrC family, sensor kinase